MSQLTASYTYCRRLARRSASSFYYSFWLLPRPQRSAMHALYAYLRQTDDWGDSSEPLELRRAALVRWRRSLERSLGGQFDDPLWPALVDAVRRFEVPPELLFAVIDGVEMDLDRTRYQSFEELAEYCHRVASVVGLACIHIWGFRDDAALEPARRCGLAFQLTNILRDLKEDADRDRVYLPQEDLDRFGYTVADLKRGVRDERFRSLMQFEILRTEELYRQAAAVGTLAGTSRTAHLRRHAVDLRRPVGRNQTPRRRRAFRPGAPELVAKIANHGPGSDAPTTRRRAVRGPAAMTDPGGENATRRRSAGATAPGNTAAATRVAVIGGGLAGMAAAVGLRSAGCRVTLLEARRYLGGRASSFRDAKSGEWVDLCQHVSMGCCTNLADFCRRTGIAPFFRRERTLHFFGPDGRRFDLRASPFLPAPLHLAPSLWRLKYLSTGDRIRIGRALLSLARMPASGTEPEPTIAAWLVRAGQSPAAIERFWAVVLVSALGESLERASLSAARKVFVDGFMASRGAYVIEIPSVPLNEIYDLRLRRWFADQQVELRTETGIRELEITATDDLQITTAGGELQVWDAVVIAVPWRQIGTLIGPKLAARLPWLAEAARLEASPISGVHLWFDRPIADVEHAVLVGRTSQWVFHRQQPIEQEIDSGAAPSRPDIIIRSSFSASAEVAAAGSDEIIRIVLEDSARFFQELAMLNCFGRAWSPTRMPSSRFRPAPIA